MNSIVPKGTNEIYNRSWVTDIMSLKGLSQSSFAKWLNVEKKRSYFSLSNFVKCTGAVRYTTLVTFKWGLSRSILATTFSLLLAFTSLQSCSERPTPNQSFDLKTTSWSEIQNAAKNTTVNLTMWQGDPFINAYMSEYIVPTVRDSFEIDLNISSGQGAFIVQSLMAELQAKKEISAFDMVWINGETFYQLRQIDALFGPWVSRLPNTQYIDFDNPFIGTDFQQPVNGYECPWGNVQMAIIYNSEKVDQPPMTREELHTFVKIHPGKFTFDNHFTGLTFMKGLLIDIAGGKDVLSGPFDEEKYLQHSPELWDYINALKPFLWKKGNTFPESVAPMHQMFANGELWFTMSNNDSEVDNKISQGLFSKSARAYVPAFGTIQNSHYMGIVKNATNKAGAMIVMNFLISLEAQLKKANPTIWGDGTVLSMEKIPATWRQKFERIPGRKNALPRSEIQQFALKELAPEYMIRLAEDFQKYVVQED
jgi:putative spermidine/putrescine transport system substrate-binding protein